MKKAELIDGILEGLCEQYSEYHSREKTIKTWSGWLKRMDKARLEKIYNDRIKAKGERV